MNDIFQLVPASDRTLWTTGALALLLLGILCLMGYLAYSSRHMRAVVSPEGITIKGGLYGRTIPTEALVLEEAKAITLDKGSPYRLKIRTNGVGLPGYYAGWFRLQNGDKALVFVTDPERVVYLPTKEGYIVLLSVAEPEAFLEALNRTMAGR